MYQVGGMMLETGLFCGNQYTEPDHQIPQIASAKPNRRSRKKRTPPADGSIDYTQTSCVPPMLLINEVKKHEILYNTDLPDNRHKSSKDPFWHEVHCALFPNFESMSVDTQRTIKNTVKKRWKSLRDCLVKAIRLKQYMNSQMRAMAFIIPYLKVSQGMESGDNQSPLLECRENWDSFEGDQNLNKHSSHYAEDTQNTFNNVVQIGDDQDSDIISIKSDGDDETILSENSLNDTMDDEQLPQQDAKDQIKPESLSDFIKPEPSSNAEECLSVRSDGDVQRQVDEVTYVDNAFLPTKFECQMIELPDLPDLPEHHEKRKLCCSESDVDFTVLDILQQNAIDLKDEDRMFLLSILSDFKRVPARKKLKVKAKIVEAIAEAME